jgi:murein DD-endopeptidase MepM/ murein hydrolase activator NlpD
VPAEPSRLRRPATTAGPHPAVRRGWLTHSLAALAVTVLGIGLAGSITPATSAQPLPTAPVGAPAPAPGRSVPSASPSAIVDPAVTAPFEGSDQQPEPLRKVLVAERAAQRAEQLAKAAEAAHREARKAGGEARQKKLTEAQKATEARAAQLAKEALERAAAARAAAVAARLAAEAAATQQATVGTATPAPGAAPAPAPAQPAPPVAPPPPPSSSGGGFAPVPNAVVGAGFGEYGLWSRYHTGLDFRAAYGVPIRSAKAGEVLFAGNSGDWAGNHVAVKHDDGMTSMSSHMSRMTVSAGQRVQAGQIIGYVGQTGRAFGAHLHYELYPAGVRYGDVYRAVNPVPWLRAAGVTTR